MIGCERESERTSPNGKLEFAKLTSRRRRATCAARADAIQGGPDSSLWVCADPSRQSMPRAVRQERRQAAPTRNSTTLTVDLELLPDKRLHAHDLETLGRALERDAEENQARDGQVRRRDVQGDRANVAQVLPDVDLEACSPSANVASAFQSSRSERSGKEKRDAPDGRSPGAAGLAMSQTGFGELERSRKVP